MSDIMKLEEHRWDHRPEVYYLLHEVARELEVEADLSARPGQRDRLLKLASMLHEASRQDRETSLIEEKVGVRG